MKFNNNNRLANSEFNANNEWIGPKNMSAAFLILTENCNLRCTYCFEKEANYCKNIMPKEIAFKAVDYLIDGYKKNNDNRGPSITFFGGEPLLCPELIEDVVNYCSETYPDIKVVFSIITNGTIYNDKVEHALQTLYDYNPNKGFNIQISVDGIPEIQDKYRPTVGGSVSSKLVEKAVPQFKKFIESHNMDKRSLYSHACLNHDTLPLMYDSYIYIRDTLGIKNEFAWVMESDWTKDDEIILEEQLNKIVTNINMHDELLNGDYFPIKNFSICSGCLMGKEFCAIGPNGDILPCHRFFFYNKKNPDDNTIILGNINNIPTINEDIREKYLNFRPGLITNEPCQVCPACNYEHTGDLYKMPNDSQIRFMPIINKYKDLYINICNANNKSSETSSNNKCNCNSNKNKQCNCNKDDNLNIEESIYTISEILNNLNERISNIEDKIDKLDKIFKIGDIIYNEKE